MRLSLEWKGFCSQRSLGKFVSSIPLLEILCVHDHSKDPAAKESCRKETCLIWIKLQFPKAIWPQGLIPSITVHGSFFRTCWTRGSPKSLFNFSYVFLYQHHLHSMLLSVVLASGVRGDALFLMGATSVSPKPRGLGSWQVSICTEPHG